LSIVDMVEGLDAATLSKMIGLPFNNDMKDASY